MGICSGRHEKFDVVAKMMYLGRFEYGSETGEFSGAIKAGVGVLAAWHVSHYKT